MGFSEALFWSSTPRQIETHFKAAAMRLEREQRARAWLAWHNAALRRMKRLPKLDELAGRVKAPVLPQPWQEMRNYARMLTVALGGEIRPREAE